MRSGDLRHRIEIQAPGTTQNDYGEILPAWSHFASVWAAIEPISGREYFAAQQMQAEVSHRIRIRYISGVVPTMRILHGLRVFSIESVQNRDERDRELVLLCAERNPDPT